MVQQGLARSRFGARSAKAMQSVHQTEWVTRQGCAKPWPPAHAVRSVTLTASARPEEPSWRISSQDRLLAPSPRGQPRVIGIASCDLAHDDAVASLGSAVVTARLRSWTSGTTTSPRRSSIARILSVPGPCEDDISRWNPLQRVVSDSSKFASIPTGRTGSPEKPQPPPPAADNHSEEDHEPPVTPGHRLSSSSASKTF